MKSYFDEFYELLKIDRKKSYSGREFTLGSKIDELSGEIDELKLALKNHDMENLKEEMGDTLWDLLALMIIAEEKGDFSAQDIVKSSIDKLKRRKHWMFEGKQVTREEEFRIWSEAKQKEKSERKNEKTEKNQKHN
jgi:nucleoside triphosphate diphosphatase